MLLSKTQSVFICIAFPFFFAIFASVNVDAQQAGGGRVEAEPVRTESRIRRAKKPTVKRTTPKKTVPPAKTAESYQSEGDKFFDLGDHDSALEAYQSAARIKPLLKSLYRIGWIHNEFEQYAEAIAALNRAAAIDPNEALVFLEKGYAHRRLKQNTEALAALKRSIALNPKSYIANYELGSLYNDLGQYREAIPYLNDSIANRSDYSEAYEELGYAQRKLGLNNEAIASFKRSIVLDPENSGAYMGLGDSYYYGTKQYKDAINAYLSGLKYSPNNHIAAYNVAWASNETGSYSEAIRWANQTLKIKPDYYNAYNEIGYANFKLGRFEPAISAYRTAIARKPDNAIAYFGLGEVYFEGYKNYALSLENYTKGLTYSPTNQTALYRSGWCYNNLKRYQEAVPVLLKLLSVNDKPAYYHRELGYTYWQLGRTAEAMTTLNRAIQLNPDEAVSHYYLGLIYVGQRNRDAAMRSYREVVRLNYPNAQHLLDQIERMR